MNDAASTNDGDPTRHLRVLAPGHAPTPFTAAEIRDATRPGHLVEMVTEQAGAISGRTRTTFVACDDESATFEQVAIDPEGQPVGEVRTASATWAELQAHASFPAASTRITNQVVELPIGRRPCLRYEVDRGTTRMTFWFAVDLPGQPVRWAIEQQGALPSLTTVTAIHGPT